MRDAAALLPMAKLYLPKEVADMRSAKPAATARTSTMDTGTMPIQVEPSAVYSGVIPTTPASPAMMYATPRYAPRVPRVTARDGSPTAATR